MITAEGLSKRYGGTLAVDNVSFSCSPGTVTGFLGPNGAGKSTTLRMMTGLTRPDAGTSTVAGHRYADLGNPSCVVGSLLDASAMHPGRSGRSTLTIAADLAGVPRSEVDQTLERVGLQGKSADRRVGAYSLGMRQRLGIGQALIARPHVLLLDEPANGLDPEGIMWMRRLLRGFADEGGTVLLSSHLLGEVQATVDRLVVIAGGRVVAEGGLDELLVSTGLVVRSTDVRALRRVLDDDGLAYVDQEDGGVLLDTGEGVDAERVARLALAHGLLITELRPSDRTGLEQLFFSLTTEVAA
ncbi:MAG: ATP-binding cassette domain-containing protein [Propionibacteriales bacterium]|nr:ATP-binding cassette domain-containing protein [Propionibacteriales bacterium]